MKVAGRPRRYRTVRLTDGRWALQGECCYCAAETGERWGACGHWELLAGRFPTEDAAAAQAASWRARQALLLSVAGPQRVRPPRRPVAA